MYGVTKVAGENLCHYYFIKHGLDVRSVRYPGLISWKTPPGGGTTDYAVAVFYEGLQKGEYEFFVSPETTLPMMYMDDAIRGTIELMEASPDDVKERTSYNLAAISFTAKELEEEVRKHVPEFKATYKPDHRQAIANSWPRSIDDTKAREDWGWKHEFDLPRMAQEMVVNLRKKFGK
jgi:nucleoside-diphosphate-sugar epimerase